MSGMAVRGPVVILPPVRSPLFTVRVTMATWLIVADGVAVMVVVVSLTAIDWRGQAGVLQAVARCGW